MCGVRILCANVVGVGISYSKQSEALIYASGADKDLNS
jgi:hypothetical protein